MTAYFKSISKAWAHWWQLSVFRNQFAISVLVLIGVLLHNMHYLRVWQNRPGILVNDLILNLLPPTDFSMPIFFIEYGCLLLMVGSLLPHPERLLKGIQMFSIVFFARTASIYFIALEPPRDMIPLVDPIANFLLHTPNAFVTKDLFFSGHVSALSLLVLISPTKTIRFITTCCTVLVGVMIMWQHVHYSMDVFFAPIASYIAYRMVVWFHTQEKYSWVVRDASP